MFEVVTNSRTFSVEACNIFDALNKSAHIITESEEIVSVSMETAIFPYTIVEEAE